MKKWIKNLGIKVGKTMAETALSFLAIGMAISEVDWAHLASVTLLAGFITILLNLKDLKAEE